MTNRDSIQGLLTVSQIYQCSATTSWGKFIRGLFAFCESKAACPRFNSGPRYRCFASEVYPVRAKSEGAADEDFQFFLAAIDCSKGHILMDAVICKGCYGCEMLETAYLALFPEACKSILSIGKIKLTTKLDFQSFLKG